MIILLRLKLIRTYGFNSLAPAIFQGLEKTVR